MAIRDALPAPWLALAAALAGAATGIVAARLRGPGGAASPESPPAASPATPPAPPAPRIARIPGAPPPEVAAALEGALAAAFDGRSDGPGAAARREEGFAEVRKLVAAWAAAGGGPPLAAAPWWRAALRRALPTGEGTARGFAEGTLPFLDRELPYAVHLPSGRGPFPSILLVHDGPPTKERLEALYGPLLRDHAVIAVPVDLDLRADPRTALLRHAAVARTLPLDPDRVVLDGTGSGGAMVAGALGVDAARQIAGIVLRDAPSVPAPAGNLGLLEVWRTSGDATPREAIAAVRPRASADPRRPAVWASVTGENYRSWGPGFVVRRYRGTGSGRTVSVSIRRDAARNAVVLETENVAEILLHLTDEDLDLDRPVKVVAGGMVIEEAKVERSLDVLRAWASQGDPGVFVAAELVVRIPE